MSILHKYLCPLYGLNILKHLLIDTFHTVCLNVVKNQLQWLLKNEKVDIIDLEDNFKSFPWNHDLKNGRIPTEIAKDLKLLNYWKADSFQKFGFPAIECILEEKIDSGDLFEIISIIARIVEIHFYLGRNGWTQQMLDDHQKLSLRLNVKVEEIQGLQMCTISLHNLLHISEDVYNFSATDNTWCAVHERAVKKYVKKSHNCKGIEVTFSKSENRWEFLKSMGSAAETEDNGYRKRIDLKRVR